jgi:hypothetical protein
MEMPMAGVKKIFFKVEGMVSSGGIIWMGCPDSIGSALKGTVGDPFL